MTYSYFNIGLIVVAVIAGLVLFSLVCKFLLGSSEEPAVPDEETHKKMECASCGWQGTMSKYVKKCPMCGDSLF
jgi:hypothetical protein